MKIKRKINDKYILPVITYENEKWELNKAMMEKLAVAQRKLGRLILRIIPLRGRKLKTWIRQETGVSDIVNVIRMAKHRLAGHIALVLDNR